MSFNSYSNGTAFGAGFFLVDDENCTRETMTIAANHSQAASINGRTVVPMGAVIPANGSTAKGILYEDIDVTNGAAPGSVVTEGKVYEDRLPAAPVADAKTAMTGIAFENSPVAARPSDFTVFDALSVTSAAGSTSGKTALTVTGHTLAPGESYVYKTDASTAPVAVLGTDLTSGWTAWNGTADITATTSHKITVAVKDAFGTCTASGNATVTSKA